MLKIIEFIKNNKDWFFLLQEKPYSLIIKEKNNLLLFKYHQLNSNMSERICQEARGLILEKDTLRVIRCAFFKFFNYGENNAAGIDYDSAKVQEKIDGSLISLYFYNGKWNIATNGMISAEDAKLYLKTNEFKTFSDLFPFDEIDYSILNEKYTYTFELVSKYNRIVIPYDKTEIFHIGTRDNETIKELNVDIGIKKPLEFKFNSITDILDMAGALPYNKEGYVVVDKYWNRIKIKSPAYVAIYHLRGKGKVSNKRLLIIIRKGEKEEFLNYFPEYENDFIENEKKYLSYILEIKKSIIESDKYKNLTRKEFAAWATKQINPGILFMFLDGKVNTIEEYLYRINDDKLLKLIEAK